MAQTSLVTLSIKPGRVPDARAFVRAAADLPGRLCWKFVEIGVVNTLIGFTTADQTAVVAWARDALSASSPDFLIALDIQTFAGEPPRDLADSPAVVLYRGPGVTGGLTPMSGDLTQGLNLICAPDLDAALARCISLRETSADQLLLLIAETL